MQEQVELADGQGVAVAFLAVQRRVALVSSVLFHMLSGVDQYPPEPTVGSQMRIFSFLLFLFKAVREPFQER